MSGWLQFGRGELGWGRRRGRRRRNRGRESRQSGYILAFTDGNVPLVYPSVSQPVTVPRHYSIGKIIWKKSTSSHRCNFSKIYIIRRQYGRYIPTEYVRQCIPTVLPTEMVCQYIPTKLEKKLFLSVKITDEKISSVIPLIFIYFLVVFWMSIAINFWNLFCNLFLTSGFQ
jgi:hypothetical protein